jgi:hypothetical protein
MGLLTQTAEPAKEVCEGSPATAHLEFPDVNGSMPKLTLTRSSSEKVSRQFFAATVRFRWM